MFQLQLIFKIYWIHIASLMLIPLNMFYNCIAFPRWSKQSAYLPINYHFTHEFINPICHNSSGSWRSFTFISITRKLFKLMISYSKYSSNQFLWIQRYKIYLNTLITFCAMMLYINKIGLKRLFALFIRFLFSIMKCEVIWTDSAIFKIFKL